MPFTVEEFFAVFAAYNAAIWPLQIVAYILGAVAVLLLFRPGRGAAAAVLALLAAMWAVNGVGYHWLFFAEVNPIARVFAAAFVVEALLLAAAAVAMRDLRFSVRRDARGIAALALIAFAAIVYPVWGRLVGHVYPAVPAFGVAPCPTTIFTIGILLLGSGRGVAGLLAIPTLWALVGGSAAILLGVPQDLGLIAAVLVLATLWWTGRTPARAH